MNPFFLLFCKLRPVQVILDDTNIYELLYPFTGVQHAANIRIGILTIKEKWDLIVGKEVKLQERGVVIDDLENEYCVIDANIVPTKTWVEMLLASPEKNIPSLNDEISKKLAFPSDIFLNNDWAIRQDYNLLTTNRVSEKIPSSNTCINTAFIFIEKGACIEHCIINATDGPVFIGKNAVVMEGCLLRGPIAIGEAAVVKMGTKIYGATTIGPNCVVGGEIKNSILFEYSNKAHDGYLGDSVIARWCNLGAGTSNSNVKNNAGPVKCWNNKEQKFLTIGLKCGLLMGDYSRAAINTSFNTGTVVGICCNVFERDFPPKYIPDFSWGSDRYRLDQVFEHINNWKKMKGKELNMDEKEALRKLYNSTKNN
jgi:UDP-N-acetylglucosamine diphosphorylase/glucosamine-1-phosphate N-acetyltransferase